MMGGRFNGLAGNNKLELPNGMMRPPAASAADSNLDESQYTYYSESVN